MSGKNLAVIFTGFLILFFSINATAAARAISEEDTDTRFMNARVVEVTDSRLSIIAQTGVEHVIAVDREKTRVTINERSVSLKEVREGDIINIELDEANPVKFALNISMRADQMAVARNRR